MYTVGRLIHQLRDYDTELTLEALLEKEEFASLLQGIYTSLPGKSKSTAQRIFHTTETTKKKKRRSAALTTILEIHEIALPQDIQNLFQSWKENPSRFWKACGEQSGTQWDSGESIENIATKAYLVVRQLNLRRLWDTILWRFYTNFFYNLALLLGNGQVNMSDSLYHRLLKALLQSEKITDEIAAIEGNLRSWTAAGSRYHKICLHLDKGALFLLPHVSDNVWEDEHSLKGSDFDLAMKHLKHRGILGLSDQLGADSMSKLILDFALAPFRWNVAVSVPVPDTSNVGGREPRTEAELGTPGGNPNSIRTLLNAAEYLAGSTQVQQSPPVNNLSIADRMNSAPPESLVPEGSHPFVGEGVPQSKAIGPPGKRMRIDSLPSLDSPLSQTLVQPIWGTNEAAGLGGTKAQAVSGMKIAIMAEVDKLERFLGDYLLDGIRKSYMRCQEEERRCMRFTDTVRLHVAHCIGEDIKLEIWLCASIGSTILQAKITSAESLMNVLGSYLFEAMKTSNWRKEQERKEVYDLSDAVAISFPDERNDSDCKIEVLLGSEMGLELYKSAFPWIH